MGMRGIYISSAAEYTEKNTNDFIVRFCVNYTIRTIIHPGHTPFFLSFGSFLFKSFWRQERRFLRSRIRRRRSSSTSTAPAAPHEYKHITLWSICSFNIDHVDRGINQLWMSLTFSSSGGNRMTGRHQKKKRKKKATWIKRNDSVTKEGDLDKNRPWMTLANLVRSFHPKKKKIRFESDQIGKKKDRCAFIMRAAVSMTTEGEESVNVCCRIEKESAIIFNHIRHYDG